MSKIGFKPEWKESHTRRVKEFEKQRPGDEQALDFYSYMMWLYGT